MSGNPAFLLLLLHMVFVVSGNPAFSLGEWPSFPEVGSIFVVPAFWLAERFGEEGGLYFSNGLKQFCNIEINL